jgi:outer membrane biosynthesis protein TonB
VPQPAVQHKVDPIEVAWPSPQLPADGLDPAEIAAVRRGSGAKWAALIVLLAAIGTGAFYFAKPSSSEPAKPAPVPAPVAAPAVVKPEVEVSPPPAPSPPVETPKPEVKAEPQPAPVPAAAPTARGFDWYIQQGLKRRERGQTEQALNAYEKAAELDPESAEPPTGKGFCLFDLGNYAGAQTAFKEALRKNPRFHDAMLGLAETYKEMHQNKKAIEQYKKYLEEAPEGQEADLARASIERLSQE